MCFYQVIEELIWHEIVKKELNQVVVIYYRTCHGMVWHFNTCDVCSQWNIYGVCLWMLDWLFIFKWHTRRWILWLSTSHQLEIIGLLLQWLIIFCWGGGGGAGGPHALSLQPTSYTIIHACVHANMQYFYFMFVRYIFISTEELVSKGEKV